MSDEIFRSMLSKALAGDEKAVCNLFELYMPLINRYSYINKKLDEDLRQYILLRIFEKLPTFEK